MASSLLKSGATSPQHGLTDKIKVWYDQHRGQARLSVQRLREKPASSGVILLVLSIAILLPILLYTSLKNVEQWLGQSTTGVEVSVFLQLETAPQAGRELAQQMSQWPGVGLATYITPEEAAESLAGAGGVREILASLPSNPLPPTIQLKLDGDSKLESAAHDLVARAENLDTVESASFNLSWFRKALALVHFLQRIVIATAILLGLGVMLVIGNTVKSAIDLRKDEILVTKLVGGTNGFVRRPFLYMGLWLGALGAILSILLANICLLVLTYYLGPIEKAYGINISVSGLSLGGAITVIAGCAALGWAGAWFICNAHIRSLEPS